MTGLNSDCNDLTTSFNSVLSDELDSSSIMKCKSSLNVIHEKNPDKYHHIAADRQCELNSDQSNIFSFFPFVCGVCNDKFGSLSAYFCHLVLHKSISTLMHSCSLSQSYCDTESPYYSCGLCDITYPSLCTLYEHLKNVEGISDFVYKGKSKTVYPLNETDVDSSIHLSEGERNRRAKNTFSGLSEKTFNCSKNSDSNKSNSGNESDATIIDESYTTGTKTNISKNKTSLYTTSNRSKKSSKNLKRKSVEEDKNNFDNKDKVSVMHNPSENNLLLRNSGGILQEFEYKIVDKVNKNRYMYREKKGSNRKRKIGIKDGTMDAVDDVTSALLEERININDTSLDCDLEEETVDEEFFIAEKVKQTSINRKNQLFPCEVCGAVYQHQYLKKHRKTHDERTLSCDQCNNVYNCKFKLNTHKKQVHTEEMKFTCDECGKRFKAWPYLKQHRQVHIKERTIECPQCPMKFKYTAVLRMHLKTHSDQKPYSCDLCDMKFKRADLLATHKKYHGDQKTFSCPECSKLFKVKQDVKKHFKIHLPPKFFCEICGKAFVQKYNMRVHMKTHGIFP